MFEPVNALETLMQSAASNPAKIPDFYRALLDSELYILTPETELEPGRRRSLKLHEKINSRDRRVQGQDMASRVYRARARIRLFERTGDVPRSEGARSLCVAAAWIELLAEPAI